VAVYQEVIEAARALSAEERARLRAELAREDWAAAFLAACDEAAHLPPLSDDELDAEMAARRGERA
jgi:hypothetical protein